MDPQAPHASYLTPFGGLQARVQDILSTLRSPPRAMTDTMLCERRPGRSEVGAQALSPGRCACLGLMFTVSRFLSIKLLI